MRSRDLKIPDYSRILGIFPANLLRSRAIIIRGGLGIVHWCQLRLAIENRVYKNKVCRRGL